MLQPLKHDHDEYLPDGLPPLANAQTALPAIAKNADLIADIENAVRRVPTWHDMIIGDSREMRLQPESVQLVLTSPPYWTLKEYRDSDGQLGHFSDYEGFLSELDKVWMQCFRALVTGGRLICVVGDVCLSRRKNEGRHTVVPLHASIQEHCRHIGYDNLAPIIWHKIANAVYEVAGSSSFLGKPYEPNAVIKNDLEYILMQRKPGGYRSPSVATRVLSVIGNANHKEWFQQIWTGVTGASTRNHPAPYPLELAERLIRMFSFVGDTVLDPFSGTGTTAVAAMKHGRNSIGYEIEPTYATVAKRRIEDAKTLETVTEINLHEKGDDVERRVREAIKLFWLVRDEQSKNQGIESGQKDAGLRAAVTGGKHLDGFTDICRDLFIKGGVPEAHVFWRDRKELPGYYRAEKNWDLIVVADGHLLAVVEFKAQVGPSFGNNLNNRVEEAIGNASDLWAAYREGAFKPSARPWLGYVFILEDCPKSQAPVRVSEPHFKVFSEFKGASYAKRYELFLTKLIRERLYDGASLLLTPREQGMKGKFRCPSEELSFKGFAAGLSAHAIAYARAH